MNEQSAVISHEDNQPAGNENGIWDEEQTPSTALYCKVTYIPMVSAADESMARTKVKSSTMNLISCFLEESERSSSTLPA